MTAAGDRARSRARRWLGLASEEADTAQMTTARAEGGIDAPRARSLLGLSLGLVGPRANLAVSGVLLTLLVSSRVSSAVAITFALTANRFVGWIAYPDVYKRQRTMREEPIGSSKAKSVAS